MSDEGKKFINKGKNTWEKYGLIFIMLLTFVLTFIINLNVRIYGDDLFYSCFTDGDFDYFVARHVDHYMRANGRSIVHILATIFLGISEHFWAIFNSLILALIVFFGAKICMGSEENNDKSMVGYSAVIIAVAIAFFNLHFVRQSVYWLTGSFNYVYPVFMLLIFWYVLHRSMVREKISWYVPVLGFLAAATVEQASVMTFGLTLLILLEKKFFRKKKLKIMEIITLIIVFIGMLTVVCAPSVFLRASIEEQPADGLFQLILYNLQYQENYFAFSNIMLPYHMLAIIASIGVIFKYSKYVSVKLRWTRNIAIIVGGSSCIGLLWQAVTGKVINYYPLAGKMIVAAFIGIGYLYTLVYAAILIYKNKIIENNTLPIIAVILAFGAQFMMIVSPVFGPRNLIFPIFMFVLYSGCIIPKLNNQGISAICGGFACLLFNLPWLLPIPFVAYILVINRNVQIRGIKDCRRVGIAVGYLTLAIVSFTIMVPLMKGYIANAKVYDSNVRIAEQYVDENQTGKLDQKRLPNDFHGWVMPYHNDYYKDYYKTYIGVNRDVEINWTN
ncbi:hypothetical protein SH1V18_10620 [Vallitalea longa]|uniref:Uncharacterized protein n=1 Tax=Vallitalea longa TaxID=2936439 RepID=A0A9W5Y7T3_9FIRM|nr:DUF6056 family protein [Vallitalea longa]GKX28582.1 hypothetical protein SH1V18_10620 [Vallitalea longa]